jgi:hypothetical protein
VWYNETWYENHDIVELDKGGYEHNNLCYEDSDGDFHLKSEIDGNHDYRVIDDIAYRTDELFFCESSNDWYQKSCNNSVEIDGKVYHENYIPETLEETK